MKVAVVVSSPLYRSQFINKYLFLLERSKIEYDVIYWNRNGEESSTKFGNNYISFDVNIDSYLPFRKKIVSYIGFSKFVKVKLLEKNYDKLILLTTPTVVSITTICLGKYKGKYLFDYRDITKENFLLYRKLIQKLAYNSSLFTFSSEGYLFLFNKKKLNDYCICHNNFPDFSIKKDTQLSLTQPLRISYWGAIRQVDYNRRVCDWFGADRRFQFGFYGEGAYQILQSYCSENNYGNIYFTGRYSFEDIKKFVANTDILYCAYEIDMVTTPALAVKIYDSIEYQLPLIVSKDSFMAQYLKEYEHVFALDTTTPNLNELYKWYINLKEETINASVKKLFERVKKDENIFEHKFNIFLNEN